ncbi:hypothetical protein J2T09_002425 [Neorhizobium huautlense]|uniref:Uncharacterized protein n=1 Tax=Neorhizobium huautlense TaxID=67774 RepID=A0ABT9PT72_9HYPH|nr:hypothetical protein [Neorhizobium huautlense]MDP9837668.1 hypothetical protein [Neorhizobium huautlense]
MGVSISSDDMTTVSFDDGTVYIFKSRMISESPGSEDWHYYDTTGRVLPNYMVNTSKFNPKPIKLRFEIDDVWMGLRDYPALEYLDFDGDEFGDPVTTGSVTRVDLFGNVSHIVNAAKRVLVNKTMPGHKLNVGYVVRHVWAEGPRNYIQSIGFGTGPMARPNEWGADLVWGAVSLRSIRNMAMRYYEQRTGKSSMLFPHEDGYDDVPLVVEDGRNARVGMIRTHAPVATLSSARLPGVMGNIPLGSETNALDVISEQNHMLSSGRLK